MQALPSAETKPMKKVKYLSSLVLVLSFILFQGCSSLQKSSQVDTTHEIPADWSAKASQLEALKHWKLIGKIGIRTSTNSFTAAINKWQQADSSFVIDLSSTFFGLGATKLIGTPNFLTIVEAGEDPLSSYEPNLLINEALGFPLPISSLSWWIKGLPTPNGSHEIQFNSNGDIASLEQNQWHLSFSKHKIVNGLSLPGKIKLERDDVRIILAVKQWTLL